MPPLDLPPIRPGHRRPGLALAGSALLPLLLVACDDKSHGPPQRQAPAAVTAVTLHPQAVAMTTELPGRISAYRTADVRPQVGGVIRDILFREGQEVTAGQPLYQIEPASYQAALDSAIAAQQKAEASVASNQLTVNRYRPLAQAGAVSRQELDSAVSSLRQAQADVASAKASVETARINLNYTRVNAPLSGRTGRSSVTPGALVTSDQTNSLVTITQLDPIHVDVTQAASSLLRLRRDLAAGRATRAEDGQPQARLVLEDGNEYDHPGTLQFSEVTVDQSTSTITLRAVFPNPDGLLMPGMYVRERITTAIQPGAFLVPQQGVARNQQGQAVVQIVTDDGTAESRVVTADRTEGNKWVVLEGLREGDQVIVEGGQRVTAGARLQVTAMSVEEFDQRNAARHSTAR